MPDLSQIPVPLYSADQPYHWEYDNLPLQALADRDEIINGQVDSVSQILTDCNGTQGTLANRLAQSINPDGSIIPAAIDEASHNIGKHTDGSVTVSSGELSDYVALGFPSLVNPVQFCRMLLDERTKLAGIAAEATNVSLSFETISNIVLFEEGPVQFAASDSIEWIVTAPNTVQASLVISTDFAHRHFYDLTPIMLPTTDLVPILHKLYQVTSTSTVYIQDSLRVFINGIRISKSETVYYPSNPVSSWSLNSYTEDYANGRFTLTHPITSADIIQIDFDQALT